MLRRGERMPPRDLARARLHAPRRAGRSQAIRIEAYGAAHASRARAAVSERQRDRLVGVPGQDPERRADAPALRFDLHDIAARGLHPLGERGPRIRRVVPGELRMRPRQFLQPGIAGEFAVEGGWIAAESDRDRRGMGRRTKFRGLRLRVDQRARRAGDDPFAQRAAPEFVEVRGLGERSPLVAHDVAHR